MAEPRYNDSNPPPRTAPPTVEDLVLRLRKDPPVNPKGAAWRLCTILQPRSVEELVRKVWPGPVPTPVAGIVVDEYGNWVDAGKPGVHVQAMNDPTSGPSTPIEHARAALLRALDALDRAEADLGRTPDRVDLVVTYAVGAIAPENVDWVEVSGWSATPGPKWVHVELLERAAEAQDSAVYPIDDEGDPDEDLGPDGA